jgi:hypothetical protein
MTSAAAAAPATTARQFGVDRGPVGLDGGKRGANRRLVAPRPRIQTFDARHQPVAILGCPRAACDARDEIGVAAPKPRGLGGAYHLGERRPVVDIDLWLDDRCLDGRRIGAIGLRRPRSAGHVARGPRRMRWRIDAQRSGADVTREAGPVEDEIGMRVRQRFSRFLVERTPADA